MKILVTGASHGLGKFLSDKLACETFTRENTIQEVNKVHYDLVIHCAFNTNNRPHQERLYSYAYDNIILTHKMVEEVDSDRFVFISSIDVYPKDLKLKDEEAEININDVGNIYGQTKLISEDIVNNHPNSLILRCGGIIGPTKKPNSILTWVKRKETTLSKTSILSYVPQQAIYDIIMGPTWETGIFNVASDPIPITDLEEFLGEINYGEYEYKAINVPTDKLKIHFPHAKIPSSRDTLLSVLRDM